MTTIYFRFYEMLFIDSVLKGFALCVIKCSYKMTKSVFLLGLVVMTLF